MYKLDYYYKLVWKYDHVLILSQGTVLSEAQRGFMTDTYRYIFISEELKVR